MTRVVGHLDEAVERVQRLRDALLADRHAPDRAARLAALYDSEARAWSQLFELAPERLVWRAALAAEALARRNARIWHRRAEWDALLTGRSTPTPVAGAPGAAA